MPEWIRCVSWIRFVMLVMAVFMKFSSAVISQQLAGVLLCTAAGVICIFTESRNKLLTCFCLCVIDAVSFFFLKEGIFPVLFCLPVCLIKTFWHRWEPSHDFTERSLAAGIILYAGIYFVLIFGKGLYYASVIYLILFIALSVFEMRILREKRFDDRGTILINAGVVSLLAFGMILITTNLFRNVLLWIFLMIYQFLIVPVLWVLVVIATGVPYLLFYLLSLIFHFQPGILNNQMDMELSDLFSNSEEAEEMMTAARQEPYLIYAAGIILFIIITILIVRRLRGERYLYSSEGEITRETILPGRDKKRKTAVSPVRSIYVRYLKYLKKENIVREDYMTSLDIEQKAWERFRNRDTGRIREIWMQERYGGQIQKDDEIRSLFKNFKKSVNRQNS